MLFTSFNSEHPNGGMEAALFIHVGRWGDEIEERKRSNTQISCD